MFSTKRIEGREEGGGTDLKEVRDANFAKVEEQKFAKKWTKFRCIQGKNAEIEI